MEISHEKVCLCALNSILGDDPAKAAGLLSMYGSASELFRDPPLQLAMRLEDGLLDKVREQLESLSREGVRFIPVTDGDYPPLLKECPDRPTGIYYKGVSPPGEVFLSRRAVAVVGTRKISPYGIKWCREIVEALSETEEAPMIVSGLAYGTDILAHVTALGCRVPTAAVMATGMDTVYPWRHRDIAIRIASTTGCCLLTDYPPTTAPKPVNFLRRNRIIAGLTEAVILIESAVKGGGLVTVRYANEYSREAYALPGRVGDPLSAGCNDLIARNSADIISSPSLLVERLGMHHPSRRPAAPGQRYTARIRECFSPGEAPVAQAVFEAVWGTEGITAPAISARTGLDETEVSRIVTTLEIRLLIRCDTAGRCFIR